MKKIALRITLGFNLFIALLLVLSSLSVHISPADAWPFAFFGLMYPFILIANMVFVFFWLFVKRKYSLISVFMIILTWNQLKKFIQFNSGKEPVPSEKPVVKLLSYNVRLFNYYQWLHEPSVPNNILSFIQKKRANIICLQEFLTVEDSQFSADSVRNALSATPSAHIYYTDVATGKRNFGIATFSSYPIVNRGVIDFKGSPNASIFSDIKIQDDTVRVYNCHLQSTRLRKDDYHLIDSILHNYNTRQLNNVKQLTVRLRDAFINRARQVERLSEHIKHSPYKVIVCGDFNDTPVSYTYSKLKDDLLDAYLESGSGIGNTYFGNFPSFRIDYILHDKHIRTFGFGTGKVKWSDHYPIICNLYFN